MKNTALKVAGVVFLVVSLAQLARFILKIRVVAGTHELPVGLSAVAFVVMFALALWMFRAAKD